MKKVHLVCWLLFLCATGTVTGQAGFDRSYRLLRSGSFVQDKNFYLLTVLEQWPAAGEAISRNATLQQVLQAKKQRLQQAATTCQQNTTCHTDALRLSAEESALINRALTDLYNREEVIRQVVSKHLRPSGAYQRYVDSTDAGLLRNAWQDAARGLNRIIDVYALGQKPRYADIDSVSYDVKHGTYPRLIDITVNTLNGEVKQYTQFFQPTLHFALTLLDLNDRDEAGRFEPLHEKANQALVQHLPQINWADYPYSVILVQGAGPDLPGSSLDAWAKLRMRLAVERYRRGLAPILVVSGGNVHPFQTPFNESMEMKKALMSRYGIPEHAILVESHSRHSTTNLRNTARLLFQYGIPTDKPMVVTADMYQSKYMQGDVFTKRCQQELGYLPHQIVKRLSPFDLVLLPQPASLYADPLDPLDP
ncbi:YdcF family protein [Spirosoma flavum]|uniref:YdcF family protein n=1 Tax=Spirosoma flavum TaxID=2048557 RepID=A0ABW6ATT5_9BACT